MSAAWQNSGTFPDSRTGGSMVKLSNGKVLYAGGYNSSFTFLSTCALFDPGPKTWSYTGSLTTARAQAGMISLDSGLVLIMGGNNSSGVALATCELYDPNAGTWSSTGSMSHNRTRFANFKLGGGTVLVAGGGNSTGGPSGLIACEIYTPGSGTWAGTGNLLPGPFGPLFGMLGDGRPLVANGLTAFPYVDYAATYEGGVWITQTAPPTGFYANDTNTTATLPSGDVVFMCPELNISPFGPSVDSYIYRVATDTWDTIDSPSTPHAGAPYTLSDGSILLAGGLQPHPGSNLSSDRCDILDPDTETWTQVASLPYAGELTATGSMIMAPVLDDGTPLWACPEINGGTIPTSNSSLLYQETTTMAETTIAGTQLKSTAVTPGSYTNTNLTVDQQGRITSAANGSAATPAGVILQQLQDSSTDGSAHTSSTFTNTDLALAITPANVANKIRITVTFALSSGGPASPAIATTVRGATNLAGGTAGFVEVQNQTVASTRITAPASITWLDSPASTSALTYRVQTRNTDGTTEVRTGAGSEIRDTILLEEIKG